MGVRITGTGSCLPGRVLTNDQIEARTGYDRSAHGGRSLDEWARAHHGGRCRRIVGEGETTATLAAGAARMALASAGVDVNDVDLLVLSTFTGDHRLPQAAGEVQRELGLGGSAKFLQVDSACTGFVDGLLVASALIEGGHHRRALVLAADVTSMLHHPHDWLPQTVFGDGAGGVVLEGGGDRLHVSGGSDGDLGDLVLVPGGGSRLPVSAEIVAGELHYWRLRFAEITPWAVDRMVRATREVLARAGLGLADIALVVPHQASCRIIDGYAEAVGCPRDRVLVTYPEMGNISGASIPVTLDLAARTGRLRPGDWVLMPAVGAGMAWGAALIRWATA